MKRTGEFVLAIIGLVLNVLAIISGSVLKGLDGNAGTIKQQLMETDAGLSEKEISNTIDMLTGMGSFLVIISVISIVLVIISLICLKGNKKPKLAGWLLIISGIVSLIEIFAGILYIIAGIMALVRKPKKRMV